MSQMPDKIWMHKDTKYNTGDVICGYQYEFAEGIEDEGGIENFVEYIRKDAFIDKSCEWLDNNLHHYWGSISADPHNFLFDFRKAMEG